MHNESLVTYSIFRVFKIFQFSYVFKYLKFIFIVIYIKKA